MRLARAFLLLFSASVALATAASPVWDSSGNGQLNGTYYFRQVLYVSGSEGISSAITFYGNIVFNGTSPGTYTTSGGTVVQPNSGPSTYNTTGTYSVSASGYGFMSSPLAAAFPSGSNTNLYFLVSNGILVGSDTESGFNDVMVAAPYSASTSLSSFSGTYTVASMFPGADATFQLNPGGGSLGTVSMSGYSTAGGAASQVSSGVKYALSNGAYSITFPTNNNAAFYQGGSISNTVGDNGPVLLYISPDGNFVFGGSSLGFDLFVGVRNASSGTSTPLSGLYYEAGFDDNAVNGLDSFYGSFNAFGGNIIGHERFLLSGFAPEGLTYYADYPTSISGTYTDPSSTVNYTVGQNGIRIGFGTNGTPAIAVALPYNPPTVTRSVYIDPTGIVNTGSSAPYTAGISPGDFITLYNGVGLANSTVFAPPGAFPTTLGGVTVLIDGVLQAPIYYVSSTQISFLVPYEASTYPIASIQVNNNGATSNIATTYVNVTTPGVFTANPVGGIGVAAMLDFPSSGGPFVVSENNPANPGDTVALFLTGLGAPFPSNGDGALGTSDSLVQTINVDVSGTDVGTLAYAGLAPGLAGLYQINFTVPAAATAGNNSLGILGPDSYSDESIIPVSSGSTALARSSPEASPEAMPAAKKKLPQLPQRLTRPVSR
jgi:uncharacterized protein (TIGR03437 family)